MYELQNANAYKPLLIIICIFYVRVQIFSVAFSIIKAYI